MSFPKEVASLKFSDCLCGVNCSLLAFKCYAPNSVFIFPIESQVCLDGTVWDWRHHHITEAICCMGFIKQGYLSLAQTCSQEAGSLPNPLRHICAMEPCSHSAPSALRQFVVSNPLTAWGRVIIFATVLIIFLKHALMAASAHRVLGWRSFYVKYCYSSSSQDLFSQPLSYLFKFSCVSHFSIPDSLCLTPKRVNSLCQRTQLQA